MDIKFPRPTKYRGRNNIGICHGIAIENEYDDTRINVINSQGYSNANYIVIPKESIGALCSALQGGAIVEILKRINKKDWPTFVGIDPVCDSIILKLIEGE